MDSKKTFLKDILDYYNDINDDDILDEVIKKLGVFLSNHFYNRYRDFSRKYSKSKKRYSKMKISDLETAYAHDKVIEFLKSNFNDNYRNYCSILFKMSLKEFIEYEKSRNEFYDMF